MRLRIQGPTWVGRRGGVFWARPTAVQPVGAPETRALADAHARADHRISADVAAGADAGPRVNHCANLDHLRKQWRRESDAG